MRIAFVRSFGEGHPLKPAAQRIQQFANISYEGRVPLFRARTEFTYRSAISDILVACLKEVQHAAKSHRDRRRFKGELCEGHGERRSRSCEDRAWHEVGARRGIR